MKQAMVSDGVVTVSEVPTPLVEPGTLLVRMEYTCISIGTEMSGIKSSEVPLWKRALQKPAHVRKVVDMLISEGLEQTRRIIQDRMSVELPTGYSGAGVVIEVGPGIERFAIGDKVACAGSQCAFHAEMVRIPENLAVHIPEGVGCNEASSVALGAIALQGVRRANPTLGETFVVIGLGIIGQLAVQILRANGCRVIAVDLDRERIKLAVQNGAQWGVHPDDGDDIAQVARLTDGGGADGVIITAASSSDAIISAAFRMSRKKARVVLVGDVGLDLQRVDFYEKELDFLISTSYGPGRYDSRYEDQGMDYPLGYVRWTENRNMSEYLRLIAEKSINVQPMISMVRPIDDAPALFQGIKSGNYKPLIALLSYSKQQHGNVRRVELSSAVSQTNRCALRVAVIGAGNFAKGMHLPNLIDLKDHYQLRAIVSRTGHNAASVGKRYGATYCTTDYAEVLSDNEVDAVLIATRHDKHAPIALEALRAGKHVLLEKPLALQEQELLDIEAFYSGGGEVKPLLLTGFNRRFSPYAQRISSQLAKRSNPMIINYRMNAGYIPLDHWVHSYEGGGRNLGEACHIYDLFTFFTGAQVTNIQARAINPKTGYYSATDNFVTMITFEDGSIATLTYTALGSTEFPKERMEIFVDGTVISLEDYRHLSFTGSCQETIKTRSTEKGQKEELIAFACAAKGDGGWPIPLWQQLQATRISFEVDRQLLPKVITSQVFGLSGKIS